MSIGIRLRCQNFSSESVPRFVGPELGFLLAGILYSVQSIVVKINNSFTG
jgi:hypothetical protein